MSDIMAFLFLLYIYVCVYCYLWEGYLGKYKKNRLNNLWEIGRGNNDFFVVFDLRFFFEFRFLFLLVIDYNL